MKTRVLIAEDEIIVSHHMRRMLEHSGYEVVGITVTGEEVVSKALALEPDVVLMDVMLAGPTDGVTAAHRIHESKDIPVVYVTAYTDDKTLARARETGPFGFVTKPFEEGSLRASIEMALYKHQIDLRLRQSEERYRQIVLGQERIEEGLIRLVKLESLIAELSGEMIAVTPVSMQQHVNRLLRTIGGFIGADRSFLHLFEGGATVLRAATEWTARGVAPSSATFQGMDLARHRWLLDRCAEGEPICVLRTADIPPEASPERDLWQSLGFRSLLIVPLMRQSAPLGYLGVAMEREEMSWSGENIRLLRIVAQNLVNLMVRHRAEEGWLLSEEKFLLLIESLQEVIFACDTKGLFTYLSRGVERLSGFRPDELQGEPLTRFIHPHDRQFAEGEWLRVLGGVTGSFQCRMLTKEGEIRQVRISARSHLLGTEVAGFTGILLDVTNEPNRAPN